MDIVSGIAAASTAIGIAKDLREIDRSVDEASYKLKIAELVSSLADTKLALADAKSEIAVLMDQVASLQLGDICPKCRDGRLSVSEVDNSPLIGGMEFHKVDCSSTECDYKTERLYNANIGKYDGNRS